MARKALVLVGFFTLPMVFGCMGLIGGGSSSEEESDDDDGGDSTDVWDDETSDEDGGSDDGEEDGGEDGGSGGPGIAEGSWEGQVWVDGSSEEITFDLDIYEVGDGDFDCTMDVHYYYDGEYIKFESESCDGDIDGDNAVLDSSNLSTDGEYVIRIDLDGTYGAGEWSGYAEVGRTEGEFQAFLD